MNNLQEHAMDREESLVCEALVCEIRDAKRWIAVVEAWQALLAVRRMAGSLRADRDYLAGAGATGGTQRG